MANSYDRIFKENIEPLQLPLLAKLLNFHPPHLEALTAKIQVTQEGEMDAIKRVVHKDEPEKDYGIQIEFHLADQDLRPRNLLHYGLFFSALKLPLRQIVIYGGMKTPQHIVNTDLNLQGLHLKFEAIVLKDIPKEIFIDSDVPEEVLLAILCDYGASEPEEVVKKILLNLKKILKRSDKIKKYQKQLVVLSRLRRIELIAKKEVEAMTIHYDIETDGLFLEGIEKGIIIEREEKERRFTLSLWNMQEFPIAKIALLVGIPEAKVINIISAQLEKEGKNQQGIELALKAFL